MLDSLIKKGTGESDYPHDFTKNNKPNITKSKQILNPNSLHKGLLYCSLIVPYITYWTVWRFVYKQSQIQFLYDKKKKSHKNCQQSWLNEPTNTMLINSYALTFRDLVVDFKTAQLMYKVKNKMLPDCFQMLFQIRVSQCVCLLKQRWEQMQSKDVLQLKELICGMVLKVFMWIFMLGTLVHI